VELIGWFVIVTFSFAAPAGLFSRAPFSFGTTEAESHYALVSLLLLLVSGVILFGAAWYLP
jgi:hypothetical protein